MILDHSIRTYWGFECEFCSFWQACACDTRNDYWRVKPSINVGLALTFAFVQTCLLSALGKPSALL